MPETDIEDSLPDETEELHPDHLLVIRLSAILEAFSLGQSEILRLAEYVEDRSTEIDNAKKRASQLITAQLDAAEVVDDEVIDRLLLLFQEVEDEDDATLSMEERENAFSSALRDAADDLPPGHTSTYVESVLRALHMPPSANVLLSSLLVSLVGELEVLVNQLARAGFERQPRTLDDSGRGYTWVEISRYESLADMRDAVVDRAIEDVLRGSLDEWVAYFDKRFKIGPIGVAKEFLAQETIQRRHCIVHNGRLVSSQYLERLARFKPTAELHDELDVDGAYLRRAADTLYVVGYGLVWAMAFKLCGDAEHREYMAGVFANRTYFLLQERRYDLVRALGATIPTNLIEEDSALVIRVNYWLAHKLDGKFDAVRSEVEDLKVASRSRQFNLVKHALLDEVEEAYRVAQSMIRDDELKQAHLFTWPLLAGVREYMRKESKVPGVAHEDDAE